MKRKKVEMPENIVRVINWKFVNGDIVLKNTCYIDLGDKNGRQRKSRATRQKLSNSSCDVDEQTMVRTSA